MDANQKFLKKLDSRRRAALDETISRIEMHDFSGLDLKKLKGFKDVFRIRKGKIRVLFRIYGSGVVEVLDVDFRNENTY